MRRATSRWPGVAWIAAAVVGVAMPAPPPAHGQTSSYTYRRRMQINDEISALRDAMRDLEKTMADWKKALDPARKAEAEAEAAHSQAKAQVQDARKALDDARKSAGEAFNNVQAVVKRITEKLESGPEIAAARRALEAARQEADVHRERVLAGLRDKEEYRQAGAALKEARDRLDLLRATGAHQLDVASQAETVLQRQTAITKLEQAALEADPAWVRADARHKDASAAYQALRKQVDSAVAQDPERTAAVKAHEDAVANLKAVQAAFEAVLKRLTTTEVAYGRARAEVVRLLTNLGRGEREIAMRQERIRKLNEELRRLNY